MDLKKIVIAIAALLLTVDLPAKEPSYEKILKQWTRRDQVYSWDNFEARMIWNATYLSDDFRSAQRRKMDALYEWSDEELSLNIRRDAEESRRADVFIVSIYAGSSDWPEVGKDDGRWRIVLETDGARVVENDKFERIPVTQIERTLYPYLDKWSELYRVSFPKAIRGGSFRLRLTGIPARSELVWKH